MLTLDIEVDAVSDYAKIIKTPNSVHLLSTNWDDFGYKTLFEVIFVNSISEVIRLGMVKIGFKQQESGWTRDKLPSRFTTIPDDFFSLGQDVEYYAAIQAELTFVEQEALLYSLRDIVMSEKVYRLVQNTSVFKHSLTRGVSQSVIHGQFKRVLAGKLILDDFHFKYEEKESFERAGVRLFFQVLPGSKPPSNIHVLIGRNGVGKTTILNNMVRAIIGYGGNDNVGQFFEGSPMGGHPIDKNYFSRVISVSFSAFDPFLPPPNYRAEQRQIIQIDSNGVGYFYIGMKQARAVHDSAYLNSNLTYHKNDEDLLKDFSLGFESCLSQPEKMSRWLQAIEILESDTNFAELNLTSLAEITDPEKALAVAESLVRTMSSGHKIVLLTITNLVDAVEEKTLVLLDEPESHLHPPLLSAFMRALSDLLTNRNGLAIIATHSPVVVQEVPKTCVWILSRTGTSGRADRPAADTFGENVGVLTREIFGLETSKAGFHELLQNEVDLGGSFEEIMDDYKDKLGVEAQGILRVMLAYKNLEKAKQNEGSE